MQLKNIIDEDFIQYKKISMFIGSAICDFKCDKLNGCQVCQNMPLAAAPIIDIENSVLVERYMRNPLTSGIVIAGLEPFDQAEEVIALVAAFRQCTADDIVIYTGYDKHEKPEVVEQLRQYPNIIIKWGRFILGDMPHRDEILGVDLASNNQYAERIS